MAKKILVSIDALTEENNSFIGCVYLKSSMKPPVFQITGSYTKVMREINKQVYFYQTNQ